MSLFFGMRVFFFFKQKTAYEMRISDWSSDVCSSDLGAPPQRVVDAGSPFHEAGQDVVDVVDGKSIIGAKMAAGALRSRAQAVPLLTFGVAQIGRASCRERVCQYV